MFHRKDVAAWALMPTPTHEVTCSHCCVNTFTPGLENWFLKDVGQCCIGLYPEQLTNRDLGMPLTNLISIYKEFMSTYEETTDEESEEESEEEDDDDEEMDDDKMVIETR
jgi:hypothetical protein